MTSEKPLNDYSKKQESIWNMDEEKPLSSKVIEKYPKELVLEKWLHKEDVALHVERLKEEISAQPTDRSIQHFKDQLICYILPEIFGSFDDTINGGKLK